MKVAIAVDEAGKIVSVDVVEHNETPNYGTDVIDAGFDALVGQDIATAQIDMKSGVTMTCTAINNALSQAAAAAPAVEVEPVEEEVAEPVFEAVVTGTVYEVQVKGMSKHPLMLAITVDPEGTIVAATCVEHTEDKGAVVLTDEALGALVGMNIHDAKLDVVSGATVTSYAVNTAISIIAANVEGTEVVETEVAETEEVEEVAVVSTVYEIQVKGMSKHPLMLAISVDEEGNIVAAACVEHTEDKGAAALTDEALSVLVGQNIADAQFDTVSGATVTSNAVNAALDLIANHVSR